MRKSLDNLLVRRAPRCEPIYSVRDRRIVGFEVLARFSDCSGTPLHTASVIRSLEHAGTIAEFDCSMFILATTLDGTGMNGPATHINVNCSGTTLSSRMIGKLISAASACVHSGRIHLEITEGAVPDLRGATAAIERLRAIGVNVGIDDVGAGRATLHMRKLPYDFLKLDTSVTKHLSLSRSVRQWARRVVGSAHDRGVPVTAEGVECAEDLDAVAALGCAGAQGRLIDALCARTRCSATDGGVA